MPHFADVVLPVPLPGLFTYALPEALASQAQAGCRVSVPFGTKQTAVGLIARLHDKAPVGVEIKPIKDIIDASPVVLSQQLSLWQWMADYYLCTIGEVFKAALPSKMKSRPTPNPSLMGEAEVVPSLPLLSPAQSSAFSAIYKEWDSHAVCLLHGVTSSGKTELYIHLIADAISRG